MGRKAATPAEQLARIERNRTLGAPLGDALRELRIHQSALAAHIGVSRPLVAAWISGATAIPEDHRGAVAELISAAGQVRALRTAAAKKARQAEEMAEVARKSWVVSISCE